MSDAERHELSTLLLDGATGAVPGLAAGASVDQVRASALAAVSRWRTRAGDPLADPTFVEVCETAARSYEAIYAFTANRPSG